MRKPHELKLNYDPRTGEIERDDGSAVADLGRFIGNKEERDGVGRLFAGSPAMARALLAYLAQPNHHGFDCANRDNDDEACSAQCLGARVALRDAGVLP